MKKNKSLETIAGNLRAFMERSPSINNQSKLSKKSGVAQATIGRILRMETSPSSETLDLLADACKVDVQSLFAPSNKGYLVAEDQPVYLVEKVSKIPLISWVTAGAWDDPIDNHHVGDAEAWLPCPLECRPEATFALKVTGESMDSGAADGYRDGEIIFVDGSQIEPKHNADVIVKNGGGKVTFKRLVNSNGTWYLKPLNPNWPEKIIELDEHATLVGRVMFSGKAR
tara:strand:+ start:30800 stop:31480 length:681 start_codon:yes stop_codon:yes gene_type:complete